MAIKLFGAVLIMLSCLAFGFYRSSIPLKRKRFLTVIDNGLEILENEIGFSGEYINVLLKRIAQCTDNCPLFAEAAKNGDGRSIGSRWKSAVIKTKNAMHLNTEDCEILMILAPELGITGRDAQINSIRHARTLLKLRFRDASDECQKTVKLYRGLGAAAGIFLSVLLF